MAAAEELVEGEADEEGDVFFEAPEELPEAKSEAKAAEEADAGEEEAARIAAAAAAAARAAAALPVGMAVVVQHLVAVESSHFNGCRGVVASPMLRESGRQATPTLTRTLTLNPKPYPTPNPNNPTPNPTPSPNPSSNPNNRRCYSTRLTTGGGCSCAPPICTAPPMTCARRLARRPR